MNNKCQTLKNLNLIPIRHFSRQDYSKLSKWVHVNCKWSNKWHKIGRYKWLQRVLSGYVYVPLPTHRQHLNTLPLHHYLQISGQWRQSEKNYIQPDEIIQKASNCNVKNKGKTAFYVITRRHRNISLQLHNAF